jgi:transcriptional regulator with XRE-family HTH domain
MKAKSFEGLFEEAKKHDGYWVADAIYTFTEELHKLAEKENISRTELARRMEVSPAYITKIFRGDVNFTIDTMVRLARRVGARLYLHLVPEEEAHLFNWNSASIEWQKLVGFDLFMAHYAVVHKAADNYGYAKVGIEQEMEVKDELLAACG